MSGMGILLVTYASSQTGRGIGDGGCVYNKYSSALNKCKYDIFPLVTVPM